MIRVRSLLLLVAWVAAFSLALAGGPEPAGAAVPVLAQAAAAAATAPPTRPPAAKPPATAPAQPAGLGDTCSPNSDILRQHVAGTEPECIAEERRNTRSALKTACLFNSKTLIPGASYEKRECREGGLVEAEAVAQARAIAQLSHARVPGLAPEAGITPDIQWETAFRGGRADIWIYNSTLTSDFDKPAGNVDLIEVKISKSLGGKYPAAITTPEEAARVQLNGYVTGYPKTASGRNVVRHVFNTPFLDTFHIHMGQCTFAPDVPWGFDVVTHSVPGEDGILVAEGTKTPCPQIALPAPGDSGSGSASAGAGNSTYNGTIGGDSNGNGVDDFFDFLEAHPELWHMPDPIPHFFFPLTPPVKVVIQGEALDALEGAAVAGEGAWDAAVAALPGVVAEAGGAIAAGDAAELGLSAAETATAEETLIETGAVLLPFDLTLPVLGLALLGAYLWLKFHGHGDLFGDPHLSTVDGLSYDLQSAGEFHALEVPGTDVDVQARFVPLPGSGNTVSLMTSIAFIDNGVMVEIRRDGTLVVDNVEQPVGTPFVDFGNGGMLFHSGSRYGISFPGKDPVRLLINGANLSIAVPDGVPTRGLLGNNDGNPGNDLVTADGEDVTNAGPSVLYGRYADSWRITDEESDFTYEDLEDTSTFTDPTFPASVTTLADFSPAVRDAAATTCRAQSVLAGPQFDDCMLDVAVTGDQSYATAAAAVTTFLQDPTAHGVDASGALSEGFESAIPANLRPNSTEAVPGGTAAGPIFDHSGYSFTVPALPAHGSATIAFDLYVFGMRDGSPATASVAVKPAGMTPVTVNLTPTAATATGGATVTALGTGETAAGQFSKYRVSLTGTHLEDQLRVALEPSGFSGAISTSVAVDNVAVSLALVPAQTFTLGLTASVADGVPSTGAGRIETRASHDRYTFTVPTGGNAAEFLDLRTCPDGLKWTVKAASGAQVASGTCTDGELPSLAPGSYTIDVGVDPTANAPATYTFGLAPIPAAATGTLTVDGGSAAVTTTAPGQNATVSFGGAAGQRVFVGCAETAGIGAAATYTLRGPDGAVLRTAYSCPASGTAFDRVTLPAAGTYAIGIDPSGGDTGTITLTAKTIPADLTATASLDGTPAAVTTTVPGQNASVSFDATAGQRVYVNCTETSGISTATYTLLGPDGATLNAIYSCPSSGTVFDTTTLPDAGTYTVTIDPPGAETGTITIGVHAVPADVTAAATAGTPVTVTTTVPGQNAAVTFAGTAGQRIFISCSETSTVSAATYLLRDPTGATVKASYSCPSSGTAFNTTVLVRTGTFTVTVDPPGSETGSFTLTVRTPPADATAAATPGGAAVSVTTTTPGQNASVSFTASAGQRVLVSCAESAGVGTATYTLRDPDSEIVATAFSCPSSGTVFDRTTLTKAGSYLVTIDPDGAEVGTFTLTVVNVVADAAATAATDGTPATLTTTTAGQNGVLSFAGTAGQRVYVTCAETSGIGAATYTLRDPGGTTLAQQFSCPLGGTAFTATTLPATGTYTIMLDPAGNETGGSTLRVFTVPFDAVATAATNGTAVNVTTTVPGQNAQVSFSATAGQRVYVGCSETATIGAATYTLRDPTGAQVAQVFSCPFGKTAFDTTTLAAAGTYTVTVDLPDADVGAITLKVFTVPADLAATAPTNGTATTVTTTVPGQNAQVSFAGTAGQRVYVGCAEASTIGAATYTLRDPGGAQVAQQISCPLGGTAFDVTTLPAAGTYTITIDMADAEVGAITLKVFTVPADLAATAPTNGTATTVTTTVPGQNATVSFAGTTGQRVHVSCAETASIAGAVTYTLRDPAGATVATAFSCPLSGEAFNTITLAATGTFSIRIDPSNADFGGITLGIATVPADPTATAPTNGTATTVTTTVPGQNASITFAGTANQRVHVNCAETAGLANAVTYTLVDPAGATVKTAFSCPLNGEVFDTTTLATAGTYTIRIDPSANDVGGITLTLHTVPADATAMATIGGGAVSMTTTVPGQNAKLSFTAAANQKVRITCTESTAIGAAAYTLRNPSGGVVSAASSCPSGGVVFDGVALGSAAGTYTVTVDPAASEVGTFTMAVTAVASAAGARVAAGRPVRAVGCGGRCS
jgi:von Willebrand factor type D domain